MKNFQDKALPAMVVALIGAAFALGLMWGKVQVYEKGGVSSKAAGGGSAQAQPDQQAPQQAAPEISELTGELWDEVLAGAAASRGDESAPVTMVEFTDYQCPFCARYFSETDSQIQEQYVQTGKVKYIVRDLPLALHPNAKPAALAARCAGDQELYWEMHDVLFEQQATWSVGTPDDALKGYAGDLGMSQATFNSCYDGGKYSDEIDADLALANRVGATGTPTFFINGQKLVGAQPFSAFQAVIDAELEK